MGHSNIIYIGVLFLVVTIVLSLFEQTYANYMVSLIFLGFGWNFLFISGTSLLVTCYKEEEKFKSQGINDLIVFTTMALASLSAGMALSLTSWKTLNFICIPFLVLIVYSSFRADILSKKWVFYYWVFFLGNFLVWKIINLFIVIFFSALASYVILDIINLIWKWSNNEKRIVSCGLEKLNSKF